MMRVDVRLRLANPLSDEEPELRTSLLPGLLATLRRNVGRGFDDVALFESGRSSVPIRVLVAPTDPPRPGTDRRPTGCRRSPHSTRCSPASHKASLSYSAVSAIRRAGGGVVGRGLGRFDRGCTHRGECGRRRAVRVQR